MVFNGINMKKTNNKFRNNSSSSNTIYSLNYKFDSNSIAGKISGTALELIKKYNDFAKDAQSNGDYISAEIFRQYAEHYRKIVTEINERKNQQRQSMSENSEVQSESDTNETGEEKTSNEQQETKTVIENSELQDKENCSKEEMFSNEETVSPKEITTDTSTFSSVTEEKAPKKAGRKSFKIIEISHAKTDEAITENTNSKIQENSAGTDASQEDAPKRVYRRRKVAATS